MVCRFEQRCILVLTSLQDTHHPPSAQDDVPKLPSLNSCKLTSLLKTPRGTYTLSSTPLLRETDRRLHEQEGDFEEATA